MKEKRIMSENPEEVLKSTEPKIREIITNIIRFEEEYRHIGNIRENPQAEEDICRRIVTLIEREAQE